MNIQVFLFPLDFVFFYLTFYIYISYNPCLFISKYYYFRIHVDFQVKPFLNNGWGLVTFITLLFYYKKWSII